MVVIRQHPVVRVEKADLAPVTQAVQHQEDAEHDAKKARGARVDGEVTIDEGAPKATAKRGPLHGLLPADDADAA
jgi:hypothetical protein